MKKTVEILLKILLSIPTLFVVLETLIFGWHPRAGFLSKFYNPRVVCHTQRSQDSIEGANYTYEIELIIQRPIVELWPLSSHPSHNITFFTFPDTYIDKVTVPKEISGPSIRYSLGEKQGLKRSMDFSYRFVDTPELKFHVRVANNLNLGKAECALNVTFY